ncbi:MAG: SAM-dependent methyltransferase [Patescibacteria group bacterium]
MIERHPASFRDRSGYIYRKNGTLLRAVQPTYKAEYDALMKSGLYDQLVGDRLLIPHTEVTGGARGAYKTLKPEPVDFITYPYEWSFSQLKDAALATLEIQRRALENGQTLKDASAYNIQFHQGAPTLIDTLSFERYKKGAPWIAYRQFCQHFLAPLVLMSKVDVRLSQLLRVHIDGIPLDLAAELLPRKTRMRPGIYMHLVLHARAQQKYESTAKKAKPRKVNVKALVASLESLIKKLEYEPAGTEWGDYYTFTNYTDRSFREKGRLVERFIKNVKPKRVWDVGGNTGAFSRIASDAGIPTVSFDVDPAAVEKNYREAKKREETNLLPAVLDLTNPTPGIGWAHEERESVTDRGPVDMVLFLALIHHMAIGNNVPLSSVADYVAKTCRHLVIEWVPKGDSQVNKLLATREDIFDDYTQKGFEAAFSRRFKTVRKTKIKGTKRTLYLMRRK